MNVSCELESWMDSESSPHCIPPFTPPIRAFRSFIICLFSDCGSQEPPISIFPFVWDTTNSLIGVQLFNNHRLVLLSGILVQSWEHRVLTISVAFWNHKSGLKSHLLGNPFVPVLACTWWCFLFEECSVQECTAWSVAPCRVEMGRPDFLFLQWQTSRCPDPVIHTVS